MAAPVQCHTRVQLSRIRGSHGGECQDGCRLGRGAVYTHRPDDGGSTDL
jgi:hypothetical protein